MFLTLTLHRNNHPIRINFDHVGTYENAPKGGGTIIGYVHSPTVTMVTESPGQIDMMLANH